LQCPPSFKAADSGRHTWKLVLANASGKLEAFAFVLEQDLSAVALEPEFAVGADWTPFMISVSDLENLLAGVSFDDSIHQADQINSQDGDEVLTSMEILRK
jgi:endonuclease G, mitochondrial